MCQGNKNIWIPSSKKFFLLHDLLNVLFTMWMKMFLMMHHVWSRRSASHSSGHGKETTKHIKNNTSRVRTTSLWFSWFSSDSGVVCDHHEIKESTTIPWTKFYNGLWDKSAGVVRGHEPYEGSKHIFCAKKKGFSDMLPAFAFQCAKDIENKEESLLSLVMAKNMRWLLWNGEGPRRG